MDALMQIVAPFRKRDPGSMEEQECVENMFQCLCSVLLDADHQRLFRKGEGIELMLRFIKEQKYAAGMSSDVIFVVAASVYVYL
jgi:beta-catenin-like protein 1